MLILLYVMDSLRRDFLGCYGDTGAHTPHLDRFAAGATRFTQATAPAAWSKASGAALLTGELPRAVRMRGLLDRLPDAVPTVAAQLRGAGWRTLAVSANPFIAHDFGLLRGFETAVEAFRPGVLPQERDRFHANHFRRVADALSVEPAALVLARSPALHAALLDVLPQGREPTFALCWSMDTHAPFFVRGVRSYFGNPLDRLIPAADPEWLTGGLTVADVVRLYRDQIAFQDEAFGELRSALEARGQWEDALVIVLADHGEAWGEHGLMGHSNGLWEEQVAVPLLVKLPYQPTGASVTVPVPLADVAATVLRAAGVPYEGTAQTLQDVANDLRPLLLENSAGWALRLGDWKLLAAQDDTPPLLFNLATDPAERRPLTDEPLRRTLAVRTATLRAEADARAARWTAPPLVEPDTLVLARLRDLGYL